MKKVIAVLAVCFIGNYIYSQCPTPINLFTTNITSSTALANWTPVVGADHYKIHYRILGTSNWSNLANIGANDSTRNLPLLQQGTTYEWEIKAFCDSTNQLGSSWSVTDTFTTINFIPNVFNPITTNTLSSTECNITVDLNLTLSQSNNEPDIETSLIISDGGYFDISSLSISDTIGYSILNTASQTISCVLIVGFIAGQNYAIINSVDSLSNLIGFFSIQNEANGIKISSTSPNDGNNYTSGFTSTMDINGLFVTPNFAGPLTFYTTLESELGDINNYADVINVSCGTGLNVNTKYDDQNKITRIYNLLGKNVSTSYNKLLIYQKSNGNTVKKIIVY